MTITAHWIRIISYMQIVQFPYASVFVVGLSSKVAANRRHLVPEVQMRRRYSAPDNAADVCEPLTSRVGDSLLLPRTQSSTTMEEIVQSPSSQSLTVPMVSDTCLTIRNCT